MNWLFQLRPTGPKPRKARVRVQINAENSLFMFVLSTAGAAQFYLKNNLKFLHDLESSHDIAK